MILTSKSRSVQFQEQHDAYLELRECWRDSPVLYVRQRFGIEPTWQQAIILDSIAPPGAKVTVRSGHGIGKSGASAWTIYWFMETHDFARVPCTAPSAHQLWDVLWGELSKWRRAADTMSQQRGDHPRFWLSNLFKLTNDSLYDPQAKEWSAIARTARKENPDALQGQHATHILYVVDEAAGIPEPIFESAEGALSTPEARLLMAANPTRTSGTFYNSHHKNRGEYTALHFRSHESPLVDSDYRARLVRKWGEGSNVVRVRCDGDFPRQEDDVLISLELTEPCLARESAEGEGSRILGVDVARSGVDRTVLLLRQGHVVSQARIYSRQELMPTVGCIVQAVREWTIVAVHIDVVGMGWGVYDRLVEMQRDGHEDLKHVRFVAVNVAEKAPQPKSRDKKEARGHRLRDYLWLEMLHWCRDEAPVFCIPEHAINEDLVGELSTPKYWAHSDGSVIIESKEDMKTRMKKGTSGDGQSPDIADALGCTFAPSTSLKPLDMNRAFDGLSKASPWGAMRQGGF